MENSQCEPCKARNRNNTPTHWCVICEEAFCLECSEHHRVQKISRSHELLDINIKPTHINISDQRCSKHENLSFEYFCIDHDSLCCKECQVELHRSCQKIMSVDIASKGIKWSQSFIDSVELIEHVLMTVPIITADRHTLIKSIEKEASLVKDEIRKVKEEAISHIEYLEKLLLEDLKLKKDKIVTNANVTINEIEDIERMTKEKKDTFDIVEKHGSEKQAFLAVHAYKTVLADLEERISTITEKTTYSSIKLNSNFSKKNITSIGTIETNEVPTSTRFVKRKKRQSQIPIVHQHGLPSFVQNQSITINKTVRGITVNEKDELIITASVLHLVNEILVYDNNEKCNYQIRLKNQASDITLIPDKIIGILVVTYSQGGIQFVHLNNRKLMNEVLIKEYKGGGVAASNENIFVGTEGNISVLDLNGRFIRSIKMNNDKLTPLYIVLDKRGNIYHSDSEVVCCTRIDGKNLFTYKPPKNNRLHGVTIDNQGYVYVVVQNQGVYRLRPDGTFSDFVVDGDWHHSSRDICFNKDCTKLYITNENRVLVCGRQ
ncbi:Hypothetical predicted protein [Mytilus galloprovincialis]|uniref:B box-type domain-containing protein n=1 Tax=Mytilus galloprovincialis TaxID=29158 RepID=A0A8B6DAI2_MYTGA|nr:Hypothetical predicted protein [Mytilus galloprovincialis]